MKYFKKVIVTEKPSVAKAISKILGASIKNDGYYSNEDTAITWCYGHLVELAEPKSYNPSFEKWNLEHLPLIPDTFQLQVKKDRGVKKQFQVISTLFKASDLVINAADAGREGELIFRYVYDLAKCKKPIQRLWISSMTEESISNGLKNLKNGNEYNRLFDAARLRSISDWLIGINATRAFSLTCNVNKVLSLGRVQTPTMYMICKRYLDNKNFKETPYFIPSLLINYKGSSFTADYIPPKANPYPDQAFADQVLQQLNNSPVVLSNSIVENKQQKPPKLYDLTSLQRNCNTKHGFTSQNTLNVLQRLYEVHKLVTYPRTDSNYLSEDMLSDVKTTFQALNSNFPQFAPTLEKCLPKIVQENKAVFDNSKVTDHHAIIPTTFKNINTVYSKLKDQEKIVYQEIVESFIRSFLSNYEYQTTQYLFLVNGVSFKSSGNTPINLGFKSPLFSELKLDKDDKNGTLPDLPEGFSTLDYKATILNKKTKAPALLTEASLLAYMLNVNSFFKETDLSNLKGSGIGTPATRASIIETLKGRKYICVKGKTLIPTDIGLYIYDKVKDITLANPKLTNDIENYLNKIEDTSIDFNFDSALSNIKKYTKITTSHICDININKVELDQIINKNKHTGLDCPKCSNKLFLGPKNYYCSTFPACDFSLFKTFLGKNLKPSMVKDIISKKDPLIKGFKSKAKKTFEAKVSLDENFKPQLVFENSKSLYKSKVKN